MRKVLLFLLLPLTAAATSRLNDSSFEGMVFNLKAQKIFCQHVDGHQYPLNRVSITQGPHGPALLLDYSGKTDLTSWREFTDRHLFVTQVIDQRLRSSKHGEPIQQKIIAKKNLEPYEILIVVNTILNETSSVRAEMWRTHSIRVGSMTNCYRK